MKTSPDKNEKLIALALTFLVHLLALSFPALQNSTLFSHDSGIYGGGSSAGGPVSDLSSAGKIDGVYKKSSLENSSSEKTGDPRILPYSLTRQFQNEQPGVLPPTGSFSPPLPVQKLFTAATENQRSLSQKKAVVKLAPPVFSADTIPEKPEDEMWKEVRDNREKYILGDIFKDTKPLSYTRKELAAKETVFMARIKDDILDGILDMSFSTFIIGAEFFYLSNALIAKGLQPDFTLEEAYSRYNERLKMVRKNLPQELDGYSLIMILQRYAENKFYPGNGSGLLLDSLFHNLNDCEGGTKEILAYLDDLYPNLEVGSNRGMLQTTTGDFIGHMQVYIAPGGASENILSNDNGIIVETTRVSLDSILPYSAGEISPLEDFILRYYPSVIEGTPLEERLYGVNRSTVAGLGTGNIVGTSNHPLKMSYGVSDTLLAGQYYDLSSIRTQKIKNEFSESRFPTCDPQIDPLNVDFANIFSNFVSIDPKMRKNLMGHYLASLEYWDNEVMPQWKEPSFIATYDDFAGTLVRENMQPGHYLKVDAENTVSAQSVESHRALLHYFKSLSDPVKERKSYQGRGRQECRERMALTGEILNFLFQSVEGQGYFFLPEIGEDFPWALLAKAVLNDCLAVAGGQSEINSLSALETEAAEQHLSLRRVLYDRIFSRNPFTPGEDHHLEKRAVALEFLFTGTEIEKGLDFSFTDRQSGSSGSEEASVLETVAEQGKTGINSGLLADVADFLSTDRLMELTVDYAKRDDLDLSLARANVMVQNVLTLLSSGQVKREDVLGFLEELMGDEAEEMLQFSAVYAHAQYRGLNPAEVSNALVAALQEKEKYDAAMLIALLNYGLAKDDAVSFYRLHLDSVLSRLPLLNSSIADNIIESLFIDLVELVRTVHYFDDSKTQERVARALSQSLLNDFRQTRGAGETLDYGIVLNKLYSLAFLVEGISGEGQGSIDDPVFLREYIRFAGKNPIGKIMISLIKKLYTEEFLITALTGITQKQQDIIERIIEEAATGLTDAKIDGGDEEKRDRTRRLKDIVGDANVIAYLLYQMDLSMVRRVSGETPIPYDENGKAKVFWYLDNLHRQISKIDLSLLAVQSTFEGKQNDFRPNFSAPAAGLFPVDFYQDDRVRESLSLLAYFTPEKGGDRKVKFRKIKDIKSLKDLTKIKITESSRKVTRQDMSLLTLSLNGGNKPQEIRQAWEDTLGVLQKHLNMEVAEDQKKYLFAPHYPYLTENNSGFIYSPEKVEDIHNADTWGGRNDILLSSYLHFKNLTGRLPDWLLRTAKKRSKAEQGIIERLEERSFLPMILECENDRGELPGALFNAKWKIRKPYGEDIFPGTLLLLRLGYLDITPDGEFVPAVKH